MFYGTDLSYAHHLGFGTFAEQAAPGLLGYLRSADIEAGLIVDLACGSGIWASHALRAGYDVVGIDVSAAMVEIARGIASGARFIVASVHSIGIPTCVAATAIGEGISYLPSGSNALDIDGLLRRVFYALAPGGLLIFDVVERSSASPMTYDASREGSDWKVHVEVREDPARHLLTRTIHVTRVAGTKTRRSVETHRLRTFDRHQLQARLTARGFNVQVTRRYGALELPPQRLGFVAQKAGRLTVGCS